MQPKAYYNENDPYAAQWLRNLIEKNLIAPGDVDERSIVDVRPQDLKGYVQCHFFAGVGGWPYALRLAGVADNEPVWTGSCPCQPFSCAGPGGGFEDERHLWPVFFALIRECAPASVFGEQVASSLGRDWLSRVRADLETLEYSVGAADLCSAGVGAPNIRQRLFWVAYAGGEGLQVGERNGGIQREALGALERKAAERADDARNFWERSDTVSCSDGRVRRIEPGSFPLVARLPEGMGRGRAYFETLPRADQGNRQGRIRGYGNAINPVLAAEFIAAAREARNEIAA